MKGRSCHSPGRIGPNAILRIMEALGPGVPLTREVLERAGLAAYLADPPPWWRSSGSGHLTGDYLLAKRIPPLAQTLLKTLPGPLAGRLLLKAIARSVWTFVGNGLFSYQPDRPHRLRIAACAICDGARSAEPLCDYFGATFERLFQVLVSMQARGIEVQCQAQGPPACTFEVHLGSPS